MSYHSHLEQAKECLAAGCLSEMRIWLRRAEPLAVSEEQAEEIRCQSLRYCLLTGQYEQSENIRQEIERHWPGTPCVIAPEEPWIRGYLGLPAAQVAP